MVFSIIGYKYSTNLCRQKRGQQWTREEEVSLWKLRRQGMQFNQIAASILLYSSLPLVYSTKANGVKTETN